MNKNLKEIRSKFLQLLEKGDEINNKSDLISINIHLRNQKTKEFGILDTLDLTIKQYGEKVYNVIAQATEEKINNEQIDEMFRVLDETLIEVNEQL